MHRLLHASVVVELSVWVVDIFTATVKGEAPQGFYEQRRVRKSATYHCVNNQEGLSSTRFSDRFTEIHDEKKHTIKDNLMEKF